ncbi:MAG: hypothetical protein HFF00_00550 [Ruminiclostridium sp.]|jgi:hypothetical protein|nr:hypothetical protein [Ruminiclostridium sp.]
MTRQQARQPLGEAGAERGEVTVAGEAAAVALEGERRQVGRWLPGGYHWTPRRGESVLVVKSGAEGEACLLGVEDTLPGLEPGEVFLSAAEGVGVRLTGDGKILLTGDVQITGTLRLNGKEVQG